MLSTSAPEEFTDMSTSSQRYGWRWRVLQEAAGDRNLSLLHVMDVIQRHKNL